MMLAADCCFGAAAHDVCLPHDCPHNVAVYIHTSCTGPAAVMHAHLVYRVMEHQGCEGVHSQSYAWLNLCCALAGTRGFRARRNVSHRGQ